jgi:hypothetical protein
MAIVFKRTEYFREQKGKPPLTNEQMIELGKLVISAYIPVKHPDAAIRKIKSENEPGTPMVIDYPRKFIPEIDRIIGEYYASIEPKKRKRIPAKIKY